MTTSAWTVFRSPLTRGAERTPMPSRQPVTLPVLVSIATLVGGFVPVAVLWWAVPHVPLVGLALPPLALACPPLAVLLVVGSAEGRRTGGRAALVCLASVIPVWMFLLWNWYALAVGLLAAGLVSWRFGVQASLG